MKKMAAVALCFMLLPLTSFANTQVMNFRCALSSAELCEKAIAQELTAQKCDFTASSVKCETSSEEGKQYCEAVSSNCSDASSDGFSGITCKPGSKKATFQSRNITATWARSFLWIWVKNFCKQ